jgi:hypothetical protein
MAQIINDSNVSMNSKPLDYTLIQPNDRPKIDYKGWAKSYLGNVSSTPVLCKDGTTKSQLNDPTAKVMDACRNNGGRAENQPVIKQLQSKEEVAKMVDEEISKIKFPLKTTVITSAVPLGLAYYSYYNNYSLTKGIGVVVIGSVVAWFGALTFSGGKFV